MPHVLSFVNEIRSSSIPVETAECVAATTDAEVTILGFYTPEELDPDLRDLTAEVETLGADGKFDVTAWRRLDAYLASGEYDVFHTNHNFNGSVGRLVASRHDVAVVDTEHNDHRHFTPLQNAANAPTLPLADAVVANSDSTAESYRWYEDLLLTTKKQRTIYNGVDFSRIDRAIEENDTVGLPSSPLIVTVGSLIEQKRHKTLIEALPTVHKSVPDASLIVVGTGPRERELKERAATAGVADSVEFTGYLPTREDVYRTVAAADVFSIASGWEGFCVAVVEAMACGLPTVVSDIEVFREVVGSKGLFAPVGDPSQFATRLVELLEDKYERTRRGEALQARARDLYPLECAAQRYFDLYVEVGAGA
jgi:glycosyltransferase involved in cell wall biosynthesis